MTRRSGRVKAFKLDHADNEWMNQPKLEFDSRSASIHLNDSGILVDEIVLLLFLQWRVNVI